LHPDLPLATCCAGVASGLLRTDPGVTATGIDSGAAVVLATVHWLGLALSERVRQKITS